MRHAWQSRLTGWLVATTRRGLRIGLALILGLALWDPAQSAITAPGDLDPTFGGGAIVTDIGTAFGAAYTDDIVNALVLQPDGTFVAAGSTSLNGGPRDFALVTYDRFHEVAFANTTNASIFTTPVSDDEAKALVVQPDGKPVAAGYATTRPISDSRDFALVRYNSDGITLDTTFGGDGIVTTDIGFGGDDEANALVLQPDGKLVAAGFTSTNPNSSLPRNFALVRYLPDGSLDPTFGGDGIVTTYLFSTDSVATALVLQPDGMLVAAGTIVGGMCTFFCMALVRYLPDGSLDEFFVNSVNSPIGGIVTSRGLVSSGSTVVMKASALLLQSDGKLVVAGSGLGGGSFLEKIALVRFLPDGHFDTTFGGHGLVLTDIGRDARATALVQQPDGSLVAAGIRNTGFSDQIVVVRYLPEPDEAELDSSFGRGDGIVITDIIRYSAIYIMANKASALVQQPDGKLVVAGTTMSSLTASDFVLLRYLSEFGPSISLTNNTVAENQPIGTFVGTLSAPALDPADNHSFALVAGDGDQGNSSFTIDGTTLRTAAGFDFEAQASYSILVRATASSGLISEQNFIVEVSNDNETPTDVSLSNDTVIENQPAGTVVGILTTSEPDNGDSHTYTIVSGVDDSTAFTVQGDQLLSALNFDFELKNSYNVRLRTTDSGGLFFEKSFTILVTDVLEDVDTDGDGLLDSVDADDDNDGVVDGNDAFPLDETEQTDTDGDHIGNNADPDDDGDGTPDAGDAFPLDPTETTDSDGDGQGDASDPFPNDPANDADGDGVPGDVDNCPAVANADQADSDHDGVGDLCELDHAGPLATNVYADPGSVVVNSVVTLKASLDDSTTGGSTILSAQYSQDGDAWVAMTAQDGAFDAIIEPVSAALGAYSTPGVHSLCVRGADDAGNMGTEECILLAVYDPSAGFVTGNGWFNSPAGAYLADPELTGRVDFAFASKYQKGANKLSGETQVRFQAGNLNFQSSSYDWLVVAGVNAKFKGVGTINGTGNDGFMLTATDGQAGRSGIDTVRIKIWDKNNGDAVIYDNQLNVSDDSYAGTALGSGNIVVHSGKETKGGKASVAEEGSEEADVIDGGNPGPRFYLPLIKN